MICHAKLVSMLPVPCIILSFAESNAGGYSQLIKTGTILSNDWVIFLRTLKLFVLVGNRPGTGVGVWEAPHHSQSTQFAVLFGG